MPATLPFFAFYHWWSGLKWKTIRNSGQERADTFYTSQGPWLWLLVLLHHFPLLLTLPIILCYPHHPCHSNTTPKVRSCISKKTVKSVLAAILGMGKGGFCPLTKRWLITKNTVLPKYIVYTTAGATTCQYYMEQNILSSSHSLRKIYGEGGDSSFTTQTKQSSRAPMLFMAVPALPSVWNILLWALLNHRNICKQRVTLYGGCMTDIGNIPASARYLTDISATV